MYYLRMYCSNCGKKIRAEHTFCGHCGFDLSTDSAKDTVVTQTEKTLGTSSLICDGLGKMHCPTCHAELPVNNNFCEACGRNVNPVTSADQVDGKTFIKPKTAKKSGCGAYVLIGLIVLVVVALIAVIFIVQLISEILLEFGVI